MSVVPAPAGDVAGTSRLFALVPCAGVGARAARDLPKQYSVLAGRPMVEHTLNALALVPRLAATMVVLSADDAWFERACPHFGGWVARCGGATRALSVHNGLVELTRRGAAESDWVLVHDAARCLIQPEWVNRLIDACLGDAVGGLLAMPVADTLKFEAQGRAARTLPRAGHWAAQTPQMFRLGVLRAALAAAGGTVTDEASAVEAAGHAPLLVPGSTGNFKVTWPDELDLAAQVLRSRSMPDRANVNNGGVAP